MRVPRWMKNYGIRVVGELGGRASTILCAMRFGRRSTGRDRTPAESALEAARAAVFTYVGETSLDLLPAERNEHLRHFLALDVLEIDHRVQSERRICLWELSGARPQVLGPE